LKIDESTSDIQDSPTKSEGGEVDDAGERATEEFDIVSTSTEESEKEERRRVISKLAHLKIFDFKVSSGAKIHPNAET
jgi:hypothetical protein